MTISNGTTLGPYEILSPLGAGGMGEVYRAKDTRLDREVAIKVLPSHLMANSELKLRFDREARSISNLTHPNICTLHDIGCENGTDFIVMELLDGETLAQRITRGPLPLEQVLRYGMEIASALDAAHKQGVVHRDLKPGNIMITKSGAKLLDFGLAKNAPGQSGLSAAPDAVTITEPLTSKGTIVGTFQYMAPEQLEGKDADARTDIFAFGATLYEMATGKRAFEGTSRASLITSIMSANPQPISELQPMSPPAFEQLVKTCLTKDPEDRMQTAHDIKLQLQWIIEGGSQVGAPITVTAKRKNREKYAWITALVMTVFTLVLGSQFISQPEPATEPIRLSINAPANTVFEFVGGASGPPRISPDGQTTVFTARDENGVTALWKRHLSDTQVVRISGTDWARRPFWSPDSQHVGFFAEQKLKKISINGGPAFTLADAPDGRGGSWNRNGTIIFSPNYVGQMYRVSSGGGPVEPVTDYDATSHELTHRYPCFLPDGRHFLYLVRSAGGGSGYDPGVYLGTLDSTEKKKILSIATNVQYAFDHLLYVRDSTLLAQPFDAHKMELVGDPIPMVANVRFDRRFSRGVFSVSDNGTLIYQSGEDVMTQLAWFDRTGKQVGVLASETLIGSPAISPDEKTVATEIMDLTNGASHIWLLDIDRDVRTRFTFGNGSNEVPLWTSDGKSIVYSSWRSGVVTIFQKNASGVGEEKLLHEQNYITYGMSVTQDAKYLLYSTRNPSGQSELRALVLDGQGESITIATSKFNEMQGRFSPDGRWIAYEATDGGRTQIYIVPFPSLNGRWQVSKNGGYKSRWSKSGDELFFIDFEGRLMSAEIFTNESTIRIGEVKQLFTPNWAQVGTMGYDITRDGEKFLISTSPEDSQSEPITVVLNWDSELNKK